MQLAMVLLSLLMEFPKKGVNPSMKLLQLQVTSCKYNIYTLIQSVLSTAILILIKRKEIQAGFEKLP